jgi:hypothetical protein
MDLMNAANRRKNAGVTYFIIAETNLMNETGHEVDILKTRREIP